MILDIFEIVGNDDMNRWEFTPKVSGYTSYTVSYRECGSKSDACIAVWKSLNKK
jgi:hypothetical protein